MKQKQKYKEILLHALKQPRKGDELAGLIPEASLKLIENILKELKKEGYNIEFNNGYWFFNPQKRGNVLHVDRKIRKFAALGDTHLGSKYERLDLLNEFYDRILDEDVDAIFHTGDIIQGTGVYPAEAHDLKVFTISDQINYAIENYPDSKYIPVYIVSGNHDMKQYERGRSPNPVLVISQARKDINFVGNYHGVVVDNTGLKFDLHHPTGKAAYALSYKLQRRIEKLSVDQRPHVALSGHTHDSFYMYFSGIHVFKTGTFQDENDFSIRLGLVPALGGWLIEVKFDEEERKIMEINMTFII